MSYPIGEVFVGNERAAELFAAQNKTLALRPFVGEDEDPVECRICGRPWEDPEEETCSGDCLEGTGSRAYIIVAQGVLSPFDLPEILKAHAQDIHNDVEGFHARLESRGGEKAIPRTAEYLERVRRAREDEE